MGQLQRFPTLESLTKNILSCAQIAMEPGSCRDSELIWEIPAKIMQMKETYELEYDGNRTVG